jgi:hypothetical protein
MTKSDGKVHVLAILVAYKASLIIKETASTSKEIDYLPKITHPCPCYPYKVVL